MGHIAESVPYTQAVASMAGLPVACITAPIQAIQRENTGSTALSGIPKGYHPAHCTDEDKCTGCATCATMCPDVAITVER
ncbi:4Fe-4S binding protein, partial [Adlercreutzia sp.]|uniref:4Fe-4S binding protein n=1 Tax=Adlercreutzia sp. TaxID=1872387 RepID=UPI003FA5FD30